MKSLLVFLFFMVSLSAENFILENKTSYQKIAVQWAPSARAVQESNDALMQGEAPSNLHYPREGVATITVPKAATYFRVLAWRAKEKMPDHLTNWVELVPGKSYSLKDEHLTPVLLLNGMGC